MVERAPWVAACCALMLVLGVAAMGLPLYYAVIAATHSLDDVLRVPMPLTPGKELLNNIQTALAQPDFVRQLINSVILAVGVTVVKIAASFTAAFAVTYFNYPSRSLAPWLIISTPSLTFELRFAPSYEVASLDFAPRTWLLGGMSVLGLHRHLLRSYTGLIIPLAAPATGPFLSRQLYLTEP